MGMHIYIQIDGSNWRRISGRSEIESMDARRGGDYRSGKQGNGGGGRKGQIRTD